MTHPNQPPEKLVIYEVQGVFDGRPPGLGRDFLGYWVESGFTFFFFSREAEAMIQPFLRDQPALKLRYIHRMKYSQWQDGARFTPFQVGPLTVIPAWDDTTEAERIPIRVDPGLAFGFGGHPTSLACLEALVRVYDRDRPLKVLDLGTGTGILALAAARLGAEKVWAVEYSHLAAETARKNASLNGLGRTIEVIHGQAEDHLDYPADLLAANLHFQVQETIFERGGFDRRHWLILSGLFHGQADRLRAGLTDRGFRLMDLARDERWTTLLLHLDRATS